MNIHYSARGLELTDELQKYAGRKLARLNRKLPRRLRSAAMCEVGLTQTTRQGIKVYTCSMVLTVPGNGTEFRVKEATRHVHSALDVAAAGVEQQIKDYTRVHHRRLTLRKKIDGARIPNHKI